MFGRYNQNGTSSYVEDSLKHEHEDETLGLSQRCAPQLRCLVQPYLPGLENL